MNALQAVYAYFLSPILMLMIILVFVWVIASWLVTFNIISPHNPTVRQILYTLDRVVEPILRPIRRVIPPLGGTLDLSPLIALLGLAFLKDWFFPQLLFVWLG